MRLLRVLLRNYIGIYNGMGLYELFIDFTKCNHKILIIKGDNGSGKSTIFRALTPLNDSSSEFIYGKDGYKEIWYSLNDGSILQISYASKCILDNKSGRYVLKSPRCSIIRIYSDGSSVELNPSGNVNSTRDVIYELFDLDDNYLLLSAISMHNRGIGLLRPSERKRYVNNVINSLDDYIELNRSLAKKSNILNSILRNLVAKLDQIGNITEIENKLRQDEKILYGMNDREHYLIEQLGILKEGLKGLDKNEIDKGYSESSDMVKSLEHQLSKMKEVSLSDSDIQLMRERYSMLSHIRGMYQQEMTKFLETEMLLRDQVQELEYKIGSMNESEYEGIKKKIQEIDNRIQQYQQELEGIGFKQYNQIDSDQYGIALDLIEEINGLIMQIHDKYDTKVISKSIQVLREDKSLREYNELMTMVSQEYEKLQLETRVKEQLIEQSKLYDQIPSDCNHRDSCVFIREIVDAKEKLCSDCMDSHKRLEQLRKKTQELGGEIGFIYEMNECLQDIKQLLSLIDRQGSQIPLRKFFGDNRFEDLEYVYKMIEYANQIDIDLGSYWERKGYIEMISSLQSDKIKYERKLIEYSDYKLYSERLREKRDELNKLMKEKMTLQQEIEDSDREYSDLEERLRIISELEEDKKAYDNHVRDLEEYKKRRESYMKMIDQYEQFNLDLAKLNREYIDLKQNIKILSEEIEKLRYSMLVYGEYQKEYSRYAEMNKKLQILKESSSINGIQSVYIEAYMNKMLKQTNEMLKMLFGGRFMIKRFIVNETEFLIPCIDSNGEERQDISDMSDSQVTMISMIISFVILYHASRCYNIIKLDEIDASLDNNNRLYFSRLILEIINILNFEQCIIISHNNELELRETDMMLLKIENRDELVSLLNSGSNVIFNYNK